MNNKIANSISPLDSDDRISNLPDSILGHILSLLPTKIAVATSILSQRWKFLWTITINLDFCYPDDYTHQMSEYAQEKSIEFVQFVNYVFLLHKPGYLNRLSLVWNHRCDPFYVNAWISTAVARNVHHLFVSISNFVLLVQVPRSMFGCVGLQSLYLNCKISISADILFSLPKLESLTLISVRFVSEEAFCRLLAGCPLLKYLYIDIDMGRMTNNLDMDPDEFIFNFIVSSISLRYLELYVHDEDSAFEDTCLCRVELAAPSLEYIKLQDQISCIFVEKSLSSLVEAHIDLVALETEPEHYYCNQAVEAVRAFDCAKVLTLSSGVIWALSSATVNLGTMFKRLSKLEVTIGCCCWSSSLQDFLKLSDNLEVLTVNKEAYCMNGDRHNNSNWKDPDQVPICLSNSLMTVTVGAYDGGDDQLAFVGYILKHGNALKVLVIRCSESITDLKTKSELVLPISKLPRKSTVCEVGYC